MIARVAGLLLALAACQTETTEKREVVARVGSHYLSYDEVMAAIPDALDVTDSAEIASNYIHAWVTRQLMFDKALFNLNSEQSHIEKQVETYRQELFIFEYEKAQLKQKLDTVVTDEEVARFYDENQDIFYLNDYIMKVRYVKVLPESPDQKKLEKAMLGVDERDVDFLVEYCHKYAITCFSDTGWVYFNELLTQLPIEVVNKESFLRSKKLVKFSTDEHLYLLYIAELKSKNTLSPLDLERENIRNLILNKRKIELLSNIRSSVNRDAARAGEAEIYDKPQLPN